MAAGFNVQIGRRERRVGKRGDIGTDARARQIVDRREDERATRARFNADGLLAIGEAIFASIAFDAMAQRAVDGGSVVGAGKSAIPATDALLRVDGGNSVVILVHSACWAYVYAGGIVAMLAGKRCVVGVGIRRPATVRILVEAAAFQFVYMAEREALGKMVVVLAC